MIEISTPEIGVDEIMEKIRKEVARRRANKGTAENQEPLRANPELDRSATIQLPRLNSPPILELRGDAYHINDFLRFHDRDFITNAYRGLLKRSPDNQGLSHNLDRLRRGTHSKVEILGRLRYCPEGKAQKVKVKGLLIHFGAAQAYRIPVLGYLFRFATTLIRLPVIIRNQTRFEQYLTSSHEQLKEHVNHVAGSIETGFGTYAEQIVGLRESLNQILAEIAGMSRQLQDHKLNILDQQRRLTQLLEEARKRLPEPISTEQIRNMVKEEDHMLDAMYVSLEDQFRGTREDIKQRQKIYLPYIEKSGAGTEEAPILDIGCGRGEWLELCRENGLTAKGIDNNKVLVSQCLESGFNVEQGDALTYLRAQKNGSLGSVTGFHIIEHLELNTIIAFLDEALRVLKPKGLLILETPNPDNLIVASRNFYMDPTHLKPLPSPLLTFMAEVRGFSNIDIIRLHPFLEYERLRDQENLAEFINGPQDYSVIAYKA